MTALVLLALTGERLVLFDFETLADLRKWETNEERVELSLAGDAASGRRSLKFVVREGEGRPSMRAHVHPHDWRGYDVLRADIYNPQGHPIPFHVRIKDAESRRLMNWFFNRLELAPGKNTVEVKLPGLLTKDKRRRIRLDAVEELCFYCEPEPRVGTTFYINDVRLERAGPPQSASEGRRGPAVVTLTTGRKFIGKILDADEKKVRVRTAFANLELRRSQIKSIEGRGAAALYAASYELNRDAEVAHSAAVAWSKLGEKKKAMLWQVKALNYWDAAELAQSLGLHGWAREYYHDEIKLRENRQESVFRERVGECRRRIAEIHKTFRDEGWIVGRVVGKNPKNSVVRVVIEQTPEGREVLTGLTMRVCTNWVKLGRGWRPKPEEVKVLRALNAGDRVRVDFYWEGHYRFRKIEKE